MANGNHKTNRRRRWPIVAAIGAGVVLLAAFMSMGHKDVPIRADNTLRGTIVSTISTNGKIEPVDNFEAHAPGPATVKRALVREGDHVRAGQMLVQLEDADARAQAAKAQAQLRAAQADLQAIHAGGTREEVLTNESQLEKAQAEADAAQRNLDALRRLQQKGAASAGEVQAAQARLQAAQADLKLIQQKQTRRYSSGDVEKVQAQAGGARAALAAAQDLVRRSDIRSPRAGIVYSLPVRPGQFVNAGDLLVQVADLRAMQVRAFVDEPDIGRLRAGQLVELSWDATPGRVWQGSLTRLPAAVVSVGSRNVGEITCRVDNPDLKLLPNVNVSVNIITDRAENALTIPREALHYEDGRRFVYQVVDGRLQRRDVKIAIINLTRVQVTDGLNERVQVALGAINGRPLREGMPVRILGP